MSAKNAARTKMGNIRMNKTRRSNKNRNNRNKNLNVLPPKARRIIKQKRNNADRLVDKVRSFRDILKNHKNKKITDDERNKQLENRYKYAQAKRVYWYSKNERKKVAEAVRWKKEEEERLAAGLDPLNFSEINKEPVPERSATKPVSQRFPTHGGKRKTKRRKRGGHHELVLLAGAAGMKVYNSLTKKRRRRKKKSRKKKSRKK